MAEKFLFSKYSVNDDTVEVMVKGVPMKIRQALTSTERQKVQDKLISISVDERGKPQFGSPNTAAYTTEVCLVAIKSWPFVDANDNPVPINRETVEVLEPTIKEEVAARVLGYYEEVNKQVNPFEKKSDDHS